MQNIKIRFKDERTTEDDLAISLALLKLLGGKTIGEAHILCSEEILKMIGVPDSVYYKEYLRVDLNKINDKEITVEYKNDIFKGTLFRSKSINEDQTLWEIIFESQVLKLIEWGILCQGHNEPNFPYHPEWCPETDAKITDLLEGNTQLNPLHKLFM